MTIANLLRSLQRAGLDARPTTVYNASDGRYTTPAIMVYHDYNGPYPTREAMNQHEEATARATRNGYHAEQRGHYTATLIF